jgi:Ca2+-binding EF-hand superfamily protein
MVSGLKEIDSYPGLRQMNKRILGNKGKNEDEDEDEEQSSSDTDSLTESFSEIDTNKDGYISYAELTAWFAEKSESPEDLFNQTA